MSIAIDPYSQVPESDCEFLTFIDLLRWRAVNQPGQLAYTFLPDGETEEEHLTYGELDRRARAIGAWLQSLVAQGERVLLLYPPGLDYIASFFGCIYAGAIAVPAYPPRKNRSLLRLQSVVADADATVALTTTSILARIVPLFSENPYLQPLRWLVTESIAEGSELKWQAPALTGSSLVFLQYTSGSTSAPKGVMLSHQNLLHNQQVMQHSFRQTQKSVIVGWLPLYHDMGLIGNVLQPLFLGARCILMSPVSFLQQPFRWLSAISRFRATISGGPNFAYDLCVQKVTAEQRATLDLSSWEVAFNGAEPVRHTTAEQFTKTFDPCGFRSHAFQPCYGLAEATLLVSGPICRRLPVVKTLQARALENDLVVEAATDEENARSVVGCGQPLMGQRLLIVHPQSLLQCKPGHVGEIWISGQSIAQGYWNRTEETENTFQASLADTGEGGFLRSGDLGFIENGELFVTGRLKDLVIIRGLNHYPQDIEFTVQCSDPSLRRDCGAAFSLEVMGEERLVVVQEVDRRKRAKWEDICERIVKAVADEHEIETYTVVLIRAGSVPKTSSGKIQRHACRLQYLDKSLKIVAEWRRHIAADSKIDVPASPLSAHSAQSIQTWLRSLLAVKLGMELDRIDVNQPISRYGLDSLTAIELMHGIEAAFNVRIPLTSFLESPTIFELSDMVVTQVNTVARPPQGISVGVDEKQSEHHPLSRGQQALWFLYEMSPASAAYNISRAARIVSESDLSALQRAFQSLVDRHSSLRTTISSVDGVPVQRVHAHMEVCFLEEDALMWADELLRERLDEEANRAFDLEQGPLFRVSVFRRPDAKHVLLVVVHHMIADFWSLAVLVDELSILYHGERVSASAQLAPLALQYSDYVQWQEVMLKSADGERLWAYWEKQLAGELAPLDLPADHPRPALQSYRGGSHGFELSAELSEQLKALGQSSGATLYMVLLAAFQTLLHRYTRQTDIIVGSPTSGRKWSALSGVVGYFVNPVVIRVQITGELTFTEFLSRVRQTALDAFEHQDYPFTSLVERLQPGRNQSRSPLFQVMFALQKAPQVGGEGLASFALGENGARLELQELVLESIALGQRVSQFDLTLMMAEANGAIRASLEYSEDMFEAGTIARMAGHFKTLLKSIAADPDQRLCELPLLTARERECLLVQWNATGRDYPEGICLHQLFEQQAARSPNATALVHGAVRLSYAELDQRATRLAQQLIRLGAGPESLVGLLCYRSAELIVGILGILKAGAAYVPADPDYPLERLRQIFAGCRLLVTQQKVMDDTSEIVATLEQVISLEELSDVKPESGDLSEAGAIITVEPDNLAYVLYTSGSTGLPKGVAITHRSAVAMVRWALETYSEAQLSGVLASTSICFDLSVYEVFAALSCGGKVILAENALQLPRLPSASEVTLINTVPSAMAELVRIAGVPGSVEVVNLAGEALSRELVQAVYEQTSARKVWNLYGPTEDTTYSTFALVSAAGKEKPLIGRPINNTRAYLLDGQMAPVVQGAAGDLYLAGAGLARGYLGRPEMTAEVFVPDPFAVEGGGRLYRTGDVAKYRDRGELEYVGRVDQQVKVRGYRIELGEIEAALFQHPSVRDVVVVAREDSDGSSALVAYTVPEQGHALLTSELRSFLRHRLPDYMVPSLYETLEALPLTSNGKVNRRALPEPQHKRGELEVGYVAPQTPVEEMLSDIWSTVLRVEHVGVHDNFFDLGGHSLLATQVVSRMRTAFSVEIELASLFETPTVAGLARRVEQAIGAGDGARGLPMDRVTRDEPLALSFAQQRLWFLDQLEPGRSDYNIPIAVRLEGTLNIAALEQTLSEVVRRHEVLRTTFALSNQQPVQLIHPPQPLALPLVNLGDMAQPQRELEVQKRVEEEAQRPFSLSTGPLIRATLLQLKADEHVLMLTMHHIVSDGWSLRVLVNELAAAYESFTSGAALRSDELPIQYADYAAWQRKWVQGALLDQQLSYWKRQLSGAPPVLDLPTDRARPSVQTHCGAVATFQLNAELTGSLKQLSRREGVTLFMTLMAGFKTLLYRYSGQDEIVVGVPSAGRNRAEVEGLIGFFVNTLVLRTELKGDPTFRELMERVKQVALSAYAHQDVPFEKLVEELQPERNMSHSPLFQVTIALQNVTGEELALPGLKLTSLRRDRISAKFDLTLEMIETHGEIAGSLEYNTDLFDSIRIKRMLSHFDNLLRAAVANPEQRVSTITLLTDAEQEEQLIKWNDTRCDYPQDRGIHQLFEAQVKRTPKAVALVFEDEELSYDELNRNANQLARHLQGLGVGPEVRVAILMDRCIEMVVGLLAVLKAGGTYVPLDPAYPRDRLSFMLADSSFSLLLTRQSLSEKLSLQNSPPICVDMAHRHWEHESENDLEVSLHADSLAYVIYTSGSTGQPKGVMNSHRAIVNRLLWMQGAFSLTIADAVMQKTPFSFDVSVWEFFWPLMTGARLVIARPGGHREPAYLVQLIEEQQITVLHFVPSMLQTFIEERRVATACSSLRQVICSGEALSYAAQQRFFERLPAARLANLYGPTEAAVDVTCWECERETQRQVVPIGRPIANTQIYIVDKQMQLVPIGVTGEVLIGGVGVGRGYLARQELTAERFIPDRFSKAAGARVYRTGDVARFAEDGAIEYLGRSDNQVKVRGHRIELGEIEAVLLQHPAVQEATVLVVDDSAIGPHLVAYIVPDPQRAGVLRRLLGLHKGGRFAGQLYYELPNGLTVVHQNRGETEFLYQEIFVEQSYLKHGIALEAGDCVFDVGANIGMFSLFVRQQCPTARIYAFEPLPPLFRVLKTNMALYAEDVELFECGLSDQTKSETFSFYPHLTIISGRHADVTEEREVVRSFLLSGSTDDATSEEMVEELLNAHLDQENYLCELKTLSDVIAEQAVERIDLLKIDVEKSEMEVLAGIKREDWQKIKQLIVEVHDVQGRLDQVKLLLKENGYALVVEQDTTLKQTNLFNIYATREASKHYRAEKVGVGQQRAQSERQWNGPLQLTNDVRDSLKEKLPAYMVPSTFIVIDEMPLTPNGKIDRRALAKEQGLGGEAEYEKPRTALEQWLAETWAAVLGLERVGVNDNFFDLGGHSLLGTQIVFRLRDSLQLELPLRSLFEAPTVAGLAAHIEDIRRSNLSSTEERSYPQPDHGLFHTGVVAGGNGSSSRPARDIPRRRNSAPPPIRATPRDSPLPLSFAQQRLWFLDQLAGANSTYNMLGGMRLSGHLDTTALQDTINEIVRRHEALRTNFVSVDGRPQQIVDANRSLTVELLDWRSIPADAHQAAVEELASKEVRSTFDLTKGPLLRVKLVRLNDDEHVALVVMHHIISDGWSIAIFLSEVKELYEAFRNGRPSPRKDLPIQYADFARWQREWLRGDVLEAQLDYWRSTLGGILPVLELPITLPRLGQPTFRSARLATLLPAGLYEQLQRLSRQRGVTLYMVLLAAFNTLLYRYTKQDDIIVGTAVAGRNYAGVEELIGVFINMLVMRTDLSGNPRFGELLNRVKEIALEAYAHQDVPFEKLVVELQPQRALSQTPIFQVAFGLQNAPVKTVHLPHLQLTPITFNIELARYDLTLWMIEGENGLTASWTYSTELFSAPAVTRMQTHFQTLLHSIVSDPETQLSALEMYSESEKTEQATQDEVWKQVNVKKLVSGRRRAVNRAAQDLTGAPAELCND